MDLSVTLCDPTHPSGFAFADVPSFTLSFSIALLLQPLTMFHHKIQFWPLATLCLIVLFFHLHTHSFNLPLPCAFLLPKYLYNPLNNTPCTALHLLLLVVHCPSVSTTAVSHRDTCSIVAGTLPRLKTLLFQRLSDPGAVTVDAEGLEELLLGSLERNGWHLGLGVGGQGEEVSAAAPLAQRAEQTKQVGLGHSGYAQFVPRGKTLESPSAECSLRTVWRSQEA